MRLDEIRRPYDAIIGLGGLCQIAYQLKRLNLRSASYPFDWFSYLNVPKLADVLRGRFKGFMEKKNLRVDSIVNMGVNVIVQDTATDCWSIHDFLVQEGEPPLHEYDEFKMKLERKISRFFEHIERSESILFVRSYASIQDAAELKQALDQLVGSPKFQLLVINYHDDLHDMRIVDSEWQLDRTCGVMMRNTPEWFGGCDDSWNRLMQGVSLSRK